MLKFGSATSAYQVEGGNKNDFSEGGLDAGRACDHYRLFEKDFDIAKSLGQNAHRFSIEWSRIEPEEGQFNNLAIEHYRQVIMALRERGLEPFVTLWHFTNPIWFVKRGGWLQKESVDIFARYVRRVVSEYKDLVSFWIPLNEPEVYADMSHVRGKWPPYRKNFLKALKILKNLRLAHAAAYDEIKKIQPSSEIGIATNLIGGLPIERPFFNIFNHGTLRKIKNKLDFIGLNYYLRVSLIPFHKYKKADLDWEIYPKGVYQTLKDLKKYKKPVYITENGIADASDKYRAEYIRDHVFWINKAIEEGSDVRGYFYWSLLDNYEWHHGFKARFGLVEVDYNTMERRVRNSAYEYTKICRGL